MIAGAARRTLFCAGARRWWKDAEILCRRSFSSDNRAHPVSDITRIPLSEPVSWLPKPRYATVGDQQTQTHVTRLENGLRVASAEQFGNFCTVGVLVDSGSRYECPYPSGVSHFLEKLAFSSTEKFASRDEILLKLEEHGGVCDCQGSRDTLIYAASARTAGLDEVVELLAEAVLKPSFTAEELEATRAAIGFELESLDMRPDPDTLMVEYLHAAAYGNNTLGLPKICPRENLDRIDRSMLYTYMYNHHTPERMVLAGVGMRHEELVAAAKKYFVNTSPVWDTAEGLKLVNTSLPRDLSTAQYTGGLVTVEKDLSSLALGPSPMPELVHFAVGLESCSHEDPQFVAFCVLHTMLGGGGSFSAGGPGKGMYTRLYTHVLNRLHWMHAATAEHHAYRDSGMFAIRGACPPTMTREAIRAICREFAATRRGVSQEELSRAKTQLQSTLMMNLETRAVAFEDIGRQVLASGMRHEPQYYYDAIGAITEADIIAVAERMLATPPAVAFLGDLSHAPTLTDVNRALTSNDSPLSRTFSLFK